VSAVRAAIFLTAASAVVGVSAAEEVKPSGVEAAKRDLQALPKTQQPVEALQRRSLFSGSNALPGLSLASPAPSGAPVSPGDKTAHAKTGEWLLDGVNQLEADSELARNSRRDQAPRDTLAEADGQARTLTTINPLTDYLTRWMRPDDHRLLTAEPGKTPSSAFPEWSGTRSEAGMGAGGLSPLTPNLALTAAVPGLDFPGRGQTTVNPYLNESVSVDAPRYLPETSSAKTAPATPLPALDLAVTAVTSSSPAPRVEQTTATPVAPPTSRLVDDRKYFPQLRRF
jgi:hypothetical protein